MVALILAGIYAVCYAAIKTGLPYAPPLRFGGLRATIAGLFLLLMLRVMHRPVVPPRRLWRGVLGLAVLGTAVPFGAMFSSPKLTGTALASVLGNTTPLISLLLALPLLGERLSARKLVAIVLGLLGVTLLAAAGGPEGRVSWTLALPILAATGFSFASVWVKRMDLGGAVLETTGWQLALGGGLLLVASAVVESQRVSWTPTFLEVLIFLALVGSALTTTVWYWLLQRDEVGRLSVALFLTPAIGVTLGVVLFKERLAPNQLVGIGLILSALVAMTWKRPARSVGGPNTPQRSTSQGASVRRS